MGSVYVFVLIVLIHESYVEGLKPGGLTNVLKATPEVQAVADAVSEIF